MAEQPGRKKQPPAELTAVPKLNGGDYETGPFVLGRSASYATDGEAARAVIREVPGLPLISRFSYSYTPPPCSYPLHGGVQIAQDTGGDYGCHRGASYDTGSLYYQGGYSYNFQDWDRRWLTNGGCIYNDMNKVELATPSVLSAYDHVAAFHAMLRWEQEALARANAKQRDGESIVILVNNTDGRGNSWGGHTNFLVTRRCFQNMFERKLQYLLHFASFLVSSLPYTGAGKVGSENGRPPAAYQLSQRADFCECLVGTQTTYHRPIVNARDESHAGSKLARIHNIFFDNTLCHVSTLLKIGVTQIVLAMIEQEQVSHDLILDDPLLTLIRWSHDPTLKSTARLVSGSEYTAVETQLAFLERAQAFVAAGRAEGIVPRAADILAIWQDTLLKLQADDLAALVPRLDWVLKLHILYSAMKQRADLKWDSPKIKYLDHLYASLDPEEGLFWAYDRDGVVERVVSDAEIERFVHEAPEDTRAWLRAELLKRADPETVEDVNWDHVRFKFPEKRKSSYTLYSYYTLKMRNPLRWTRRECEPILQAAGSFEDALAKLGVQETNSAGQVISDTKSSPAAQSESLYLPAVVAAKPATAGGNGGGAGRDLSAGTSD